MECDRHYQSIFDPIDAPQIRSAKAHSTVHDRGEHVEDVRLRTTYYAEYLAGGGLLLSRLRKLAPGLEEFFGQLLDPAFRRRIIVGGRSCHYYTPSLALARIRDLHLVSGRASIVVAVSP
jgi:hypothetical protein